jgi:hypothetical protein
MARTMKTATFYFGVLYPVARTLSRLLEEPPLPTTLRGVLFYILPLHVSAFAGHLQAEYTIIFGKLLHYNRSDKYCQHLPNPIQNKTYNMKTTDPL